VWRDGQTRFKAGIPSSAMDRGGKAMRGKGKVLPIAYYARIMEFGGQFGGQRHPPRPVFTPTRLEYLRRGFPEQGERSLNIIKGQWR
jgi:hypothetical protein